MTIAELYDSAGNGIGRDLVAAIDDARPLRDLAAFAASAACSAVVGRIAPVTTALSVGFLFIAGRADP